MLRTLFAGALAVLLALPIPTVTAQTTIQTVPEITMGRTSGAWDLPGDKEAGRARGVLVDLVGRRFVLDAKLMPSLERGDQQSGRILGVLLTVTREGKLGRPIAEVSGGYLAGADGLGSFEAVITPLDPLALRRGFIEGRFADPMVRGTDPVGRYAGRWYLR